MNTGDPLIHVEKLLQLVGDVALSLKVQLFIWN